MMESGPLWKIKVTGVADKWHVGCKMKFKEDSKFSMESSCKHGNQF